MQMAEYVVLLALVIGQFWVNRADPAKRPTLITLVASITVGILLYLLVTLLPMIGVHAPLGEVVAFPLFCLIYAGIGLSIVGSGVFTLDGWSRSIMLSVTFSAVVLVVDLVLLRWLVRQQDVALGLSVAGVTLAYLPVREWLSRRAERRRDARTQRALSLATDLAFATTDEERAARWRLAVEATFLALETGVDPEPAPAPRIAENGVALQVPAVAGAPALICRHADGGRRAFRRDDVAAADALVAIVTRMVEARDAFVNGAMQERGRIARDLHDNVGGRLLTSLHRRDVAAMRHDVRDAMADIRTIISSLDGAPRRLGELLADLRHECAARCDGAGLELDWPLGAELEHDQPVASAFCRHLTALVRETLSNVLRHAGAARVTVRAVIDDGRLAVSIADDGRGLSDGDRRGHGLANCAERAKALGGRFEAAAQARGTRVRFDAAL
jgi:signal transduction histidine kinase